MKGIGGRGGKLGLYIVLCSVLLLVYIVGEGNAWSPTPSSSPLPCSRVNDCKECLQRSECLWCGEGKQQHCSSEWQKCSLRWFGCPRPHSPFPWALVIMMACVFGGCGLLFVLCMIIFCIGASRRKKESNYGMFESDTSSWGDSNSNGYFILAPATASFSDQL
eukprot:TRINITY_DN15392_c0_g1_i1.p1 TRINITY_DN15392_c0_g1~~TRINITY_DN15392_c0_g1_i1.p1  ORF type:complete len:163 (+),score=26.96 TRINITY_DN15392_c0_g1_i1:30-518(+)